MCHEPTHAREAYRPFFSGMRCAIWITAGLSGLSPAVPPVGFPTGVGLIF